MSDQVLRDLEVMVTLFQSDGWKELSIESPSITLLLSRDTGTRSGVTAVRSAVEVAAKTSEQTDTKSRESKGAKPAVTTSNSIDPTWSAVDAPNLGTFYRSPKPGAPPFVEVGQRVEVGTEVCLIEVMKLFTSVQAEVAGTVRHIAVADAELVEGGQALIYIEQD